MNRRLRGPAFLRFPRSIRIGPMRRGRFGAANGGTFAAMTMAAALLTPLSSGAQVITVDTGGGKGPVATEAGQVDRQFSQITPTHVDLPKGELDPKSRLQLIRDLQSDQGFANRPFPRGHKGLTLEANGKLDPAGVRYLNMVISEGLSAKPGTRVVVTDVKIEKSRIVLDFDGGPDAKHRFLRHLQIGVDNPNMGDPNTDPTLMDAAGDPAGSRISLVFPNYVPELTTAQVKELLNPLISFDVKSPIQAYTDTLPPALKDAILNHKVLVGMNIDMVMFAKGQPNNKQREMEGQMPFEEWIYGVAPEEVTFVRINGNRVIRVEIAKEGQPLEVFTTDVVSPMLVASGSPELAETKPRIIKEGDVAIDPDKQEAPPPPTLRKPGETLPNNNGEGEMRPVQMPKPHTDQMPGTDPDEQSSTPPATTSPSQPATQNSQPQPATQNSQPQPATGAQPQTAPHSGSGTTPAQPQTPAGSDQLVSSL